MVAPTNQSNKSQVRNICLDLFHLMPEANPEYFFRVPLTRYGTHPLQHAENSTTDPLGVSQGTSIPYWPRFRASMLSTVGVEARMLCIIWRLELCPDIARWMASWQSKGSVGIMSYASSAGDGLLIVC
jgi:hypothetical protein